MFANITAKKNTTAGAWGEKRGSLGDITFLWAARIISSLSTLAVLAVAGGSVSLNQFAQFAFLIGLVGWVPVLDFGFGSVMQNRISQERACGRGESAAITACLIGSVACSGVVCAVLTIIIVTWHSVMSPVGVFEQPSVLASLIVSLALSGVAATVHKIYAATNRLSRSALVSAIQNLMSLAGLWLVLVLWYPSEPKLTTLVIGYFVPYTIVPLISLVQVMVKMGWSSSWMDEWRSNSYIKDAFKFWFILLLSLTVIQFDQFIAFTCLPALEFGAYTVGSKLISFLYFPYSALLTSNWSRMSVAFAQGNKEDMHSIVRSSLITGVIYLVIAILALLVIVERFSYILPEAARHVELPMLAALGLVAINKVWTESYALIYLGTGSKHVIASYLPIQATLAVGLQFFFVRYIGAYGLMLGGALSYFATSHWILYTRTKDITRGL